MLRGCHFIVEDNAVGIEVDGFFNQFSCLACAGEVALAAGAHKNAALGYDTNAKRSYQFGQLVEQALGNFFVLAIEVGADEVGAFNHLRSFPGIKHRQNLEG